MLSGIKEDYYTRKLTAEDEGQFIQLLRAVYGETYSYHFLYETGGFSSLINEGNLTSYGEFDSHHRLLAHTGFWHKEKNSDHVESGSSFRLAAGSAEFKARRMPANWQDCLAELALEYAFIHQQCSTLHSLAQRYAGKFMHAKPCGVLVDYAQNEKVRGVADCKDRFHALMMTTVLQPHSITEKTVYIPEIFHSWLSCIYENINIPRKVIGIKSANFIEQCIDLITLETNPYISMQRRLLVPGKVVNINNPAIPVSPMRSDIIHLPIESSSFVNAVLPMLLDLGYMPCGLRPHVSQSDELILQHLTGYKQTIVNINDEMKIADKNTKLWVEQWQRLILQIM